MQKPVENCNKRGYEKLSPVKVRVAASTDRLVRLKAAGESARAAFQAQNPFHEIYDLRLV